jgi:alpha-mannosidase
LVASLLVKSDAPGCVAFSREIRVIDGLDRADIINVLDKRAVRQKESVHLGFAFHVPGGVMRMDMPWAVVRPEIDQMPGACKNWFPVGRWVDVSNQECGVTWATLDAPMVEVGGLTAERIGIGPHSDPAVWLGKLEPSQTLYSWVMNNYWELCFKADQDGPTTFRYALLPHKQYDAAAAQRFGIERSQPLVTTPARRATPPDRSFLELDTPEVIVASIKPSNDRKALIVRLFGAGGKTAQVSLHWGQLVPKAVRISNLAEEPGKMLAGPFEVPALGVVTLRAELP